MKTKKHCSLTLFYYDKEMKKIIMGERKLRSEYYCKWLWSGSYTCKVILIDHYYNEEERKLHKKEKNGCVK